MEGVVEALNRARALSIEDLKAKAGAVGNSSSADPARTELFRAANLSPHYPAVGDLKNRRIVAFDSKDRHTRIFDLVRNALLEAVGPDESRVFAVAAPARGCGISTLAANLAFSIARNRQWEVVMATFDQPRTFTELGLRTTSTRSGVVAGAETDKVQVEGSTLYLANLDSLAGDGPETTRRATLVGNWTDRVRQECGPTIMILDLPPLPTSDEAASIARRADAALLVMGVGSSTLADLEACRSALARTPHYIVLNKARPHGL